MAFDDLSIHQRALIVDLVARLTSGDFCPKLKITPLADGRYSVVLEGVGGATDAEFGVCELGELEMLERTGYASINRSDSTYRGQLSLKAYEEYESLESVTNVFGMVPTPTNIRVDDQSLERIAKRSEQLLHDLQKNFDLYRRQASLSFVWTLVVSTVGMLLLGFGIALSLVQNAGAINLASISGVLTEFLAAAFFKQASTAQKSQDRCQRDLTSRQRILDLVDFTRLISDETIRDAVTQDLIRSFVVGTRRANARRDKERRHVE